MPWWGRWELSCLFELAQGVEQVALVPGRGAVRQFASAGLHPAFRGRVRPRRPDPALKADVHLLASVTPVGQEVRDPARELCEAAGLELEVLDQAALRPPARKTTPATADLASLAEKGRPVKRGQREMPGRSWARPRCRWQLRGWTA